jgi:DNA-binding GntR family transcriptional regulator
MIDAIENQQAERAVELTLQHWALSQDRMERFVRPDPLPVDLASARETANAV